MKRYVLFSYGAYSAGGGQSDCDGFFDSIEDMEKHLADSKLIKMMITAYYQWLDTHTGEWSEEKKLPC